MATRYEVVARGPNGELIPVGFTARVSRRGLLNLLQVEGDRWAALMSDTDEIEFHCRPRIHATVSNGWWFGFTGNTQKQVEG